MRKMLALLAFISWTMVLSSWAQTESIFTTTTWTNIRSGSGLAYTVRAVAHPLSHLTITGRSDFEASDLTCLRTALWKNAWVRVDFQGIEGWVRYCDGLVDGDVNTLPVVEPLYAVRRQELGLLRTTYPFSPTAQDSIRNMQPPDGQYVIATKRYEQVRVYASPALDAELLDILSASYVYVTGVSMDGLWYYVEYEGTSPFNRDTWIGESHALSGWVFHETVELSRRWRDVLPVKE